ncbi:MAG TPA: hypothetical protein VGC56_15915 [Allosphingosinicella sp.]|jgi:hypothetical protein
MNRLSPLVARTPRSFGRARVGAIGGGSAARVGGGDLRLFVTTWLGGVVFFTTLLA